ncbi:Arginase/deacetylase [Atractiella rhizophila]|nr:Arginase/deacetylase [Atractiella rhizophila]
MPIRVAYISSTHLTSIADKLPSNLHRSSYVHSLHRSFSLLSDSEEEGKAQVYAPLAATAKDLGRYHSKDYIKYLFRDEQEEDDGRARKRRRIDSDIQRSENDEDELHGLKDDCPRFDGLKEYVTLIAGGSMLAAQLLRDDRAEVAIFWDGGSQRRSERLLLRARRRARHLELKRPTKTAVGRNGGKKIRKVFYLDLDIHHGDGVHAAFPSTSITSSSTVYFYPSTTPLLVHLVHPLRFYPSPSPSLSQSCIPIPFTVTSSTLTRIFQSCILPMIQAYDPDALGIQCGVDGLTGDPMNNGCGDLSLSALGECLHHSLSWARENSKKALLLGGGGYNNPNAARAWTYFTSLALREPLNLDRSIPDEEEFYTDYAPSFTLGTERSSERGWSEEEEGVLRGIEEAFEGWIGEVKDVMGGKTAKLKEGKDGSQTVSAATLS